MKSGSIPANLTFFVQSPKKVKWGWEDTEEGSREFEVRPCFISDTDNPKTLETGRYWAGRYDHTKYNTLERKNEPFQSLQIITLEIRSEGGRAYKVCVNFGDYKNLYFDLREDVLLDIVFNNGIKAGGLLDGPFIFARVGAQMKVIRVNSLLHTDLLKTMDYKKKNKCKLEIGGMYKNNQNYDYIYLGQYYRRKPTLLRKFQYGGTERKESYDYGNYFDWSKIEFKEPELVHVFYPMWNENEIWFYKENSPADWGTRTDSHVKGEPNALYFEYKKSHSFRDKFGTKEIPGNYVHDVQQRIIDRYEKYRNDVEGLRQIGSYAETLTLSKTRDNPLHPILKQFVLE